MDTYTELKTLIGKDATFRLMSKYGSKVIYVPSLLSQYGYRETCNSLLWMWDNGYSLEEITIRLGLQRDTVIDMLETLRTKRTTV